MSSTMWCKDHSAELTHPLRGFYTTLVDVSLSSPVQNLTMTLSPIKPPPNMLLTSVRVASERIEALEDERAKLVEYAATLQQELLVSKQSRWHPAWPWIALCATIVATSIYVLNIQS